ncbi:MAG: hypothetical protein LBQ33_00555 [Oscillospiraceae bacterium]|nr:hypothetical protein [Oscillospiraceae bacterium]
MKRGKILLAAILAVAVLPSLCACSFGGAAAAPETTTLPPPAAKTKLPGDTTAAIAYFNQVVVGIRQSKEYNQEVKVEFGDIEAANKTLMAAVPTLKKVLQDALSGSETFQAVWDYPLLQNALLPADVAEIKVLERLDVLLAEKLTEIQADIDAGRLPGLADATTEQLREEALNRLGSEAQEAAQGLYQIDILLKAPLTDAVAVRYVRPADKADILAELKKAKNYLLVEDYSSTAESLSLFVLVAKETDRVTELRLTEISKAAAEAVGVGTLAQAGKIALSATATKTVSFTSLKWGDEPKET